MRRAQKAAQIGSGYQARQPAPACSQVISYQHVWKFKSGTGSAWMILTSQKPTWLPGRQQHETAC